MICIKTGIITTKTAVIDPQQKRSEFEGRYAAAIETRGGHNGFHIFGIRTTFESDESVLIQLHYNPQERLYAAILILDQGDGPSDWKEWDEAKEMARKDQHDAWLLQHYGPPPYAYRWGSMRSYYEVREGTSMIALSYN